MGGDSAAAPGGVLDGPAGVSAGVTGAGSFAGVMLEAGADGVSVEGGWVGEFESSPPQAPLASASIATAATDRNLTPSMPLRSLRLIAMAAGLIHPTPTSLCVTLFFMRVLQASQGKKLSIASYQVRPMTA
jgi:hypothetical protein